MGYYTLDYVALGAADPRSVLQVLQYQPCLRVLVHPIDALHFFFNPVENALSEAANKPQERAPGQGPHMHHTCGQEGCGGKQEEDGSPNSGGAGPRDYSAAAHRSRGARPGCE